MTQSGHISGKCRLMITAHAPGHVIYHRGDSPHFWNHWPRFVYVRCVTVRALYTTKIKPCYRRKMAFIPL